MHLNHLRRGEGPPLVLIHGIGSHLQIWQPVLDRLATQREVIALDLPGFGASPPLPANRPSTPGELARAVGEFMDTLGLEQAAIGGNSLGGAIALELADQGRASSVVAISPLGFNEGWELRMAIRSLKATRGLLRRIGPLGWRVMGTAPVRTLAFRQMFARPSRVPSAAVFEATRDFASCPGFERTLASFPGYRAERAPGNEVPVTIAWGTHDRLLLPRGRKRAATRFPNAQVIDLEKLGHAPMSDDPDLVARVLLR